MNRLLSAGLVWMVSGCVTGGGGISVYQQPSAPVSTGVGEDAVFSAAVQNAEAQGWNVVLQDKVNGRMEALTPEEGGEGMVTRERWTFVMLRGELRVQKSLEMQEDDVHHWVSTREICKGYEYARENEQLARVAARLALDTERRYAQR